MPEISPEIPVPLERAVRSNDVDALMTLAAFLISAGGWSRGRGEAVAVLPEEDLSELGLGDWRVEDPSLEARFDLIDPDFFEFVDDYIGIVEPDRYYAQLRELIAIAFESRKSVDVARAVSKGISAPDPLLRICALISAVEVFSRPRDILVDGLRWFVREGFGEGFSETTAALLSALTSRVLGVSLTAVGPPASQASAPSLSPPGLMLIHGTNFPPFRPLWSVPGQGPLFQHISTFRGDLYWNSDYYRWEGGYSAYAREVAAMNLSDWIARRGLNGIDVVTHSHGGNVLMLSTHSGNKFGKVLLMSCPVHWPQYQPAMGSIQQAHSVRIKFDLVIAGDRAAQRFPKGSGIGETILPIWFLNHSTTTEPTTWRRRKEMEKFLR